MNVILTHEQADFDALASLLCAHLLDESAVPVIPARMNHNVQNFLNLYGVDFPFTEARDLPHQSIQQVTLVDTQSLITLKGITGKTEIKIIDHHEPKAGLPPDWQIKTEKVGATTTILVDLVRESSRRLTVMDATLLLLGIYEDTGSLTYASTSVRDVQAAAYLLEKGASLRIAAQFLNPALSEGQKALADRLLENVNAITIHGKSIVISSADAVDLNEEISTIAHKLRDLLDPDALFLFVHTSEGIRLVARSTTDLVDVSGVARHFGGGGHERASAALIQVKDQADVPEMMRSLHEDLVAQLQKVIKPSLTINKIMSHKPHLLSPATSLDEANRLMQRYGYEGYPVVDDGKVVGLLTRRAVDRALQHKLKLNAGSLMEAGEHTVRSTDPIEELQQLMAATGWGQIPVIDPETDKIVGIVTRTDLLKSLPGQNGGKAGQQNYSGMLEKALPAPRLALLNLVADFASSQKAAIYIVGGFVRDLLLDRPSLDFDFVVEGDALQFAHALAQIHGGRVVSHKRFSTAKWMIKNIHKNLVPGVEGGQDTLLNLPDSLDFISARTEFYDHPTALPTVERSSIKLDLHRRDFTINTLALRLDGQHYGELYDFWGGLQDLEKKLVRVLHSLSFVDDPTRLLRAVRFEQRFQFTIEKRTLQLMKEARELLRQLSGERIRHEFDLIFKEPDVFQIMRRLHELGLLAQIHPELGWTIADEGAFKELDNYTQYVGWKLPRLVGNTPVRGVLVYLVWLSALENEAGRQISERLRLPRQVCDTLDKINHVLSSAGDFNRMRPSEFARALEKIPIYGVYALFCRAGDENLKRKISNYAGKWRFITPGVDGRTLLERGVPPGPAYTRILTQVRDAWLDGVISTPGEEATLLDRLVEGSGGRQDD